MQGEKSIEVPKNAGMYVEKKLHTRAEWYCGRFTLTMCRKSTQR